MYADIRVVTDCGNVVCSQGRVVAHLSGTPETELRGSSFGPGHVCAHTHIYSGLAPFGMPAPEPSPENFLQILERVWWRLDRALTADLLQAEALLGDQEAQSAPQIIPRMRVDMWDPSFGS